MKQKKWLKILLPIVAVAAAGAIGLGIFQTAGQQNGEPVNVYPFEYIGMTEYWADSQESYGPVQTDKVQTVYLSETQSVVQVLVQPGDVVQKGDLLMVFDTTLSDLALERERLNVEKLKLQLQDAKDYLTEIKNMKPMVVPSQPETPEETEPNLGIMLTDPYQLSDQSAYDGSSPEKAMICWIREGVEITDELLEAVRLKSEEFRAQNVPEETEPQLITVRVGIVVPSKEEDYALDICLKGTTDAITTKLVAANSTNTTVELTGIGTVEYDLYIDGEYESTMKVKFSDD